MRARLYEAVRGVLALADEVRGARTAAEVETLVAEAARRQDRQEFAPSVAPLERALALIDAEAPYLHDPGRSRDAVIALLRAAQAHGAQRSPLPPAEPHDDADARGLAAVRELLTSAGSEVARGLDAAFPRRGPRPRGRGRGTASGADRRPPGGMDDLRGGRPGGAAPRAVPAGGGGPGILDTGRLARSRGIDARLALRRRVADTPRGTRHGARRRHRAAGGAPRRGAASRPGCLRCATRSARHPRGGRERVRAIRRPLRPRPRRDRAGARAARRALAEHRRAARDDAPRVPPRRRDDIVVPLDRRAPRDASRARPRAADRDRDRPGRPERRRAPSPGERGRGPARRGFGARRLRRGRP